MPFDWKLKRTIRCVGTVIYIGLSTNFKGVKREIMKNVLRGLKDGIPKPQTNKNLNNTDREAKISLYPKTGKRAATAYYRLYQYISEERYDIRYRKMLQMRCICMSCPYTLNLYSCQNFHIYLLLFQSIISVTKGLYLETLRL